MMVVSKREHKTGLKMLFLSVAYLIFCCVIFFFLANVLIDLIFDGRVSLNGDVLKDILTVSIIVGTAGGLGSWIFAKIDESKSRKST